MLGRTQCTNEFGGASLRRWRIEKSLGWAARHLALAQIALYQDVHGCMPTRLDHSVNPTGSAGCSTSSVDPTHRISFQQTTIGPVVQFDMPSQIQECWEWRDGDWMRHRGFTESDSDSDRQFVERMRASRPKEDHATDPGHMHEAPLFYPIWPR